MLLIAHRGLMHGPNTQLENVPEQINQALQHGYDAEIDVWYKGELWWLGHDSPKYPIEFEFIGRRGLWIHCKNLPAFFELRKLSGGAHNYFWHESDTVVFTSHGYVWTYLGKPETESIGSICVMPESSRSIEKTKLIYQRDSWYGMCSDYVASISA